MKYTDRFQAALTKTKNLALSIEPIRFNNALSVEEINHILKVCVNALYEMGYTNSESLGGKCIPVNMILIDVIEKFLDTKAYITIGDRYWDESDIYCEMTYDYITKELKNPDVNKPIDAHVWLTLTDGTIIDFTSEAHLDTLYKRGSFPIEDCFQVVRPENMQEGEGMHRPFLIGSDFLFKTSAIQFVT